MVPICVSKIRPLGPSIGYQKSEHNGASSRFAGRLDQERCILARRILRGAGLGSQINRVDVVLVSFQGFTGALFQRL
ncbi:MAG: hypothetical protein KAG72_13555, partial [Abyssibacter sp.]